VKEILTLVLYAGYLDKPDWGISLIKGHHEPLISFETYQKIQERLNGKPKVPVRKDINEDFPLRGFIACASCGHPMTACWSRGRGGLYAYYLCHGKSNGVKCSQYGKSIRREKIEGDFEALLKEMKPSKEMFLLIAEILSICGTTSEILPSWRLKKYAVTFFKSSVKQSSFLIELLKPTAPYSSRHMKRKSAIWKKKKSDWMKISPDAVAPCNLSKKLFKPLFHFSLTLINYGF